MIKRLQKRFIAISASVICAVFALIFIIAYTVNASSINQTLDGLTDMLSENDGRSRKTCLRESPTVVLPFPISSTKKHRTPLVSSRYGLTIRMRSSQRT